MQKNKVADFIRSCAVTGEPVLCAGVCGCEGRGPTDRGRRPGCGDRRQTTYDRALPRSPELPPRAPPRGSDSPPRHQRRCSHSLLGDGRGWGFATAAGLETGRARPIYTVFRACVRRGAAAARVGGSCAPPESASVWGSSAGHIGATRRRVSASTRRSNGARSFCSELSTKVSAIVPWLLILLDHLPRQRDRLAPNSRNRPPSLRSPRYLPNR